MFSSIDSETWETNAQKISEVSSNSFSNVVTFGVQVCETSEPSIVEEEWICPWAERSFAMEICRYIRGSWEFETRSETSIVRILEHEVMSKVRWRTCRDLRSPCSASTSVAITMSRPHVISSTTHVIDNSISVDSETSSAASLNHVSELLSSTVSAV